MITRSIARVVEIKSSWDGAIELIVDSGETKNIKALAYPDLVGTPLVGQAVLLNTTALDKGLGTGGYAFVIAILDADAHHKEILAKGHLVKARYTPLQNMVLGVDEQDSEFHSFLQDADDLDQMPVVVADLHSALPAILTGIRFLNPLLKVAYILTDGGALPAWFSKSVATLRNENWIECCISAGQAFGGDLEAVNVHTALLAAKLVVKADLAIVIQGPGNLGTGTTWGFSGVAAGEAINAVNALNGRAIGALRVSGGDSRARHLGVSHHSLTAYGKVALSAATIVNTDLSVFEPTFADLPIPLSDLADSIAPQLNQMGALNKRLDFVSYDLPARITEQLANGPVRLSTMGRGLNQDPAAFLFSAAAGAYAASQV